MQMRRRSKTGNTGSNRIMYTDLIWIKENHVYRSPPAVTGKSAHILRRVTRTVPSSISPCNRDSPNARSQVG